MKEKQLTITINKPLATVFEFALNPQNTPLWVESVFEEKTNEWPVQLGTIYKNRGHDGSWSEFVVTEYIENELFTMTKKNDTYHVRYTLRPLEESVTELTYYEWMDTGELDGPFTMEILEKLKTIIESI